MIVEFYKDDESRLCGWIATPPNRRAFQGTTMAAGRDLPHDLAQFVAERELQIHEGFWGLLANGATFKSVPGRKLTKPGAQLVRDHYDGLLAAEGQANTHVDAWRKGGATPIAVALDAMLACWRALKPGEKLKLEWTVSPVDAAPRRPRNAARRGQPPARRR